MAKCECPLGQDGLRPESCLGNDTVRKRGLRCAWEQSQVSTEVHLLSLPVDTGWTVVPRLNDGPLSKVERPK